MNIKKETLIPPIKKKKISLTYFRKGEQEHRGAGGERRRGLPTERRARGRAGPEPRQS